MADGSVTANAGSGGAKFATFLDGSSINWPYSLIAWNEGGTVTEVAAANPLPVTATLGNTTNAGATAKTTDYDTGAGTDTVTMFGIALPASGGAVAGGTSSNPIQVSLANTAANSTAVKTSNATLDAAAGAKDAALPASGVAILVNNSGTARVPDAQRTTGGSVGMAIAGVSASDAAMELAPVTIGGRASTATPTAVSADGDVVNLWLTRTGAVKVDLGATGANSTAIKVDNSAVTQPVSGTVTANLAPTTSGGCSTSKTVSAASTNATSVKASAGQLYGVQAFNTNAAARYLKIYDKASAPTVGTDTPIKTFLIPGASAGAGLVLSWANGIALSNGLAFALTTGMADSDTAAVGATEIVVNLDYK